MLVVGLTGGIATGKTTVTAMFERLGAVIIDSDKIARQVVEPGQPALSAIQEEFGKGMLTESGRLDRAKLAELVFFDAAARDKLNAIVHPLVRDEILKRLGRLRSSPPGVPVIVDVPLLFESGFDELVDVTVVVYCPETLQLERLMMRNKLTEEQAKARLMAQMPIAEKAAKADYIIDNSRDLDSTEEQVKTLWKRWNRHENSADRP